MISGQDSARPLRDAIRRTRPLAKIIPRIEAAPEAGALPRPAPPPEARGPTFADDPASIDEGHRD